jgi:ubiquinone/menaquinone biosynthesis C-methylase UbiE
VSSDARATGSYDPARTVAGGLPAELERLEWQAALTWEAEWAILSELELAACKTILEVGCGSGAITRRLLRTCPDSRVVALDPDLRLLAQAPPLAIAIAGRVEALPLATSSADAAVARYVFQHLAEPEVALAQLRRVLRPGGVLAVVDVDAELWGFAHPQLPGFEAVYRKLAALQRERGGNRVVVRSMPALLEKAGFVDVEVKPFAVSSGQRPIEDFAGHLGPDRLLPFVDSGEMTLRDYAVVAEGWKRFQASPDRWVTLLGFVVVGRVGG